MRSVTVFPASLMRLTMSEWDLLVMEHPFTARMRSPTFSFPQRSAGLPSMMRPILWGMATHALPAMVNLTCCDAWFILRVCGCVWRRKKKGKRSRKRGSEGEGLIHWQPAEPRSLREANQGKKQKTMEQNASVGKEGEIQRSNNVSYCTFPVNCFFKCISGRN